MRNIILAVMVLAFVAGCGITDWLDVSTAEVPIKVSCSVTRGREVEVFINGGLQKVRLTDSRPSFLYYPEIKTRNDNNYYRDCGSVEVMVKHPILGLSRPQGEERACTDNTEFFSFTERDFH